MSNTVIYNEGELELNISVCGETVWLNQAQISELFVTSIDNVSLHLKNIYKDKELDEKSTIEDFSIVRLEGNRKIKRNIKHYNLDAIISVGYRVSSLKATKFRQWATKVLKSYMQNGYVINSDKITNERFVTLETDVNMLKNKIDKISNQIEDNSIKIKQGIFYDGQIFDAYVFVSHLIKSAKKSITIIDNYIDESILTLLSKNRNIKVAIYTQNITKQLKLDIEKYNKQYKNLEVKTTKNFHDRFIVIDDSEVYHVGASLKDLGNKVFAFSKMNINVDDLKQQFINKLNA